MVFGSAIFSLQVIFFGVNRDYQQTLRRLFSRLKGNPVGPTTIADDRTGVGQTMQ